MRTQVIRFSALRWSHRENKEDKATRIRLIQIRPVTNSSRLKSMVLSVDEFHPQPQPALASSILETNLLQPVKHSVKAGFALAVQ